MTGLIDIRKRIEDRRTTRDALLAEQQSPALNPKYSRASYSMLLAFAAYVELAPEEFISLIEMARIAPSINEGANAVLASLRENLGEMP